MELEPMIASSLEADLQPPLPTLSIRLDEFQAWFELAEPGARIEYHRGFLPRDRDKAVSPFRPGQRRELLDIAGFAMALAEAGDVHLVQRHYGYFDSSYLAIQRRRRKPIAGGSR